MFDAFSGQRFAVSTSADPGMVAAIERRAAEMEEAAGGSFSGPAGAVYQSTLSQAMDEVPVLGEHGSPRGRQDQAELVVRHQCNNHVQNGNNNG